MGMTTPFRSFVCIALYIPSDYQTKRSCQAPLFSLVYLCTHQVYFWRVFWCITAYHLQETTTMPREIDDIHLQQLLADGLSQTEISRRTGIPRSTLRRR